VTPGIKQLQLEADQLFLSAAEVKTTWSFTFTPPLCLHGIVLRYRAALPFTVTCFNEKENLGWGEQWMAFSN
jgi:hypothetical protein